MDKHNKPSLIHYFIYYITTKRTTHFGHKLFFYYLFYVYMKRMKSIEFKTKLSNFSTNYEVVRELGVNNCGESVGRYGRVYQIRDRYKKECYAIKKIVKRKYVTTNEDLVRERYKYDNIFREANIVVNLDLPYIIHHYGNYIVKEEDGESWAIVMEYFPGISLMEIIPRVVTGTFPGVVTDLQIDEKYVLEIAKKTLIGLEALHSRDIVHRDIKPDNILIKEDPDAKTFDLRIVDMGFAGTYKSKFPLMGKKGTPVFMPPEILRISDEQAKASFSPSFLMPSDIWALGITLYCITNNGIYPFEGDNYEQLAQVASQYNGELCPLNDNMPRINDVIKDCLKGFHIRPTATELLVKHFSYISQPPSSISVPINASQ